MMKTFYGKYYIQQNGDSLWWLGKNPKRQNDSYCLTLSKGKQFKGLIVQEILQKKDKDLQLMLAKGKQVISYTSQKKNKQQKQFKDIKKTS